MRAQSDNPSSSVHIEGKELISNDKPDYSVSIRYLQGTEGHLMNIGLNCTNVPIGVEVALKCDAPGPNPPIYIPKTKITSTQPQVFLMETNIPAGFDSYLIYFIWCNGKVIPPNAKIELVAYYNVPSDIEKSPTPVKKLDFLTIVF